jgi:hypothetical protein
MLWEILRRKPCLHQTTPFSRQGKISLRQFNLLFMMCKDNQKPARRIPMTIQEQIQLDLTGAMKKKDSLRLSVLRGMKTAIKNKEIEKMKILPEAEALQVIRTLVKQRKDSIEQFGRGGRPDLVAQEEAELLILESYLPTRVPEEEIKALVEQTIAELQANSAKDLGRVMKAVMAQLAGKAVDGKVVNELVRQRLP